MTETDRDEEREERIETQIIVDAYTAAEQAVGWHTYLEDTVEFPFEARCIREREASPLQEGETVLVVGMAPIEPTPHRTAVTVEWRDRELGVPLKQVEPVAASDDTEQAVADWHYWVER